MRKVRHVRPERKPIRRDERDIESRCMPLADKGRGRTGRRQALSGLRVAALPGQRWRGRLQAGTVVIPCVLGPNGITSDKREGDGRTPAGRFRLESLLFRADHGPRPPSRLRGHRLSAQEGWCDDPTSACYNRAVMLPFRPSHERLWRADRLYDLVVVLACNRAPIRKMRGSAIFLHVRRDPPAPTAGCVAVAPEDLRKLIRRVDDRTRLIVAR